MARSAAAAALCVAVATAAASPEAAPGRPLPFEGPKLARWLVSQTTWGTIATISNAHDSGSNGTAWANPQSFSDGIANSTNPKERSTGIPYFFMTGLDVSGLGLQLCVFLRRSSQKVAAQETPQDLMLNPRGAFSISESQINGDPTCQKTDTEDPTCARISFSGRFVDVTSTGSDEENAFALKALLSKHPSMAGWGKPGKGEHDFHIWKLDIESIFFLAFYGGSAPMTPAKYFAAGPDQLAF